jgi:hypothetical protein
VGVSVGGVIQTPNISGGAFVELAVCSAVRAVPFTLVGGPKGNADRAGGGAGGERTGADAGGAIKS